MIPFSPPAITEEDIEAVVKVLRSGWITTGPVNARFGEALADYCGTESVIPLNSATAALELALRVAGVGPGDEVIVPAYTYTASASVVDHVGARIVLVDTDPGSPVPGVERIAAAVTSRTRAIITVDFGGVPFDSRPLGGLVAGRGALDRGFAAVLGRPVIISDAAHSLGATLGGLRSGQIADLTAFSFHAVKNLTTAEGGALTWRPSLPVAQDELARRVRVLAMHGQTKDALAKSLGSGWEYDIVAPGYKANMPDVLAAIGLSQLGRYDDILARRHALLDAYGRELAGSGVELMVHSGPGLRSSAHLAVASLPVDDEAERNRIIQDLFLAGVSVNVHYKPLPLLRAYRDMGFEPHHYPHAMAFYATELTLPLHVALSTGDVGQVCSVLLGSMDRLSPVKI